MRIDWMKLSEAIERRHTKNPKEHDIEALVLSFKRFGFKAAPTLDETSGIMVAGHGRCIALSTMRDRGEPPPDGIEERIDDTGAPMWWLPVLRDVSFKSDSERDAYVIADNQHVINGGWNLDALTEMLGGLDSYEGIGFADADLAAFGIGSTIGGGDDDRPHAAGDDANEHGGKKPEAKKAAHEIEDDEIPELPKVAITKLGDAWQLGDHVLWCGDSRGKIAHLFKRGKAAVAVTSPPYASQRSYDGETEFKPIAPDAYVEWFEAVQANVKRALLDDGSWFVNIKPSVEDGQRHLYVNDLLAAHVRAWGWRFVDEFVWRNTTNGVPGHWPNRFKNAWESVYHFSLQKKIKLHHDNVSKPSAMAFVHDPAISKSTKGSNVFFSGSSVKYEPGNLARPSNVIEAASESRQVDHPAPFPVMLPAFFIAAFSDEGDIIYEPFAGSGTTLIAATKLSRRCVAVELSPAYCDVVVERWQRLTGGKAQLVER